MSAYMYYQGNRITVPIFEMGDITSKSSGLNVQLFGYTAGSASGKYGINETPAGLPGTGSVVNKSLTPLYPQPGASSYFTFGESVLNEYNAYGTNPVDFHFSIGTREGSDPTQVYFATATISGKEYLGFCVYNPNVYTWGGTYESEWCFIYQTGSNDPLNQIYDLLTQLPDPGEKGFKPIKDEPKRRTFGGGSFSGWQPAYYTDTLSQPGAPDESAASAVRSGLINVYELTEANLVALGRALFGTEGVNGLITKLQNSFLNPLDAILSLQIFPCSPDVGASEHIKLFDWSSSAAKLGTDTSGNRLTSQYKTIDFGDIEVEEQWNSFLDYDNTTAELYLPFIGAVDLPIDEVMNGSVNIQYTIDFLTGMCVANVFCTKSVPLSSDRNASQVVQHSYMGNCAVQIPLNNVSYGNIIGSLMNAASSGLRAGAGGAIMSVVESGLNGGFKPEVSTKGTINANAGFCSVLYPYITVTRPITAEPDAFQEVMGYTSYIKSTLGDYEGLCVCDEIDLTGIAGATDSELDEIRNICKSGIYV